MDISIVGYCPRSRQFGIGAASSQSGGPNRRMAARAWRGIVHMQGDSGHPPAAFAGALLDQGWCGPGLLQGLRGNDDRALPWQSVTVDAAGRVNVDLGPPGLVPAHCARGETCMIVVAGAVGAELAAAVRHGYDATPEEPLAERLVRALELAAGATELDCASAFVRVHDPRIEYAITDITVDMHDTPVAELRRIHDWLSPLYEYYAVRGLDPTVPRYPQWLAEHGYIRT